MHRDDFLSKLARYSPLDARDEAQRGRIEAFVREHPGCFDSTFEPGHLTGSAWLLDSAGQRVLLTHHRKLDKWIQLGGHADGDPDLLAVALREAQEESGITDIRPVSEEIFDLDVHDYPATATEGEHEHFDIRFLLKVHGKDEYAVSDESHDLAWFTYEALAPMDLDEAVRRMAEKWRRLRIPTSG
ncbi:MAG TPA: NUDIX hydrolase [Phycisphaerae bacterium]|nr:NUDIX hydrolase [Phycisphaerae bacterium]